MAAECGAGGGCVLPDVYHLYKGGSEFGGLKTGMPRLTAVMLIVVTSVASLVHMFSTGYMHGDGGYYRFFSYLPLFVFSMLMLVMSTNYLQMYVFWEAVGLCSYLLIGFWFHKRSAGDAAKKAFIVNRIGDFGFGLGVMLVFVLFGSLQFSEVFGRAAEVRFGKLLSITLTQTSRESYAFDRRGFMLTQSRYLGDLRNAGLLGPGDNGVLQLELRDPGGDIAAGHRPSRGGSPWPFTRLAEEAFAAHVEGGGERGAVLEPYRNYRGATVIGAWRWLPEKEMGIAVEIEAAEAYAPLQYLQIAFGGLFLFLLVSLSAAAASSLWAVRMRLRESRRMGQYTIEREIGEGGMSRVYLARHTHLKRPTAVKVLKTALASDEVVTRFEREVQLCSQLSHPNTIEIYDYGRTDDGTFYYVMEYLPGQNLESLVSRHGALPAVSGHHNNLTLQLIVRVRPPTQRPE